MMNTFFAIGPDQTILWAHSGEPAEVQDIFTREPYVLFGVYAFKRDELGYCILHGQWPDGAQSHDASIRRPDWDRAWCHLTDATLAMSETTFEALDAA
jgi:hypothetical protein